MYKFVAFVLSMTVVVFPQNNAQGTLRGVVTDPSGGRIPGATIHVHGPSGDQSPASDANGEYTFSAMRPGAYDVDISAPDFKTEQKHVTTTNGATTLDVQLPLQ